MNPAKRILLCALIASFFLFAGCLGDESPPPVAPQQENDTVYVNATLEEFAENNSLQNNSWQNEEINGSAQNPQTPSQNSSAQNESMNPPAGEEPENSSLQNSTNNTQEPAPPEFKITGSASLDSNMGRSGTNRCKISTKASAVKQGDSTGVIIYAYSPNEEVTYLCGDEERVQGRGGLFQDERICYFNTLGLQSIWIALDGEICATAPVRVYNDLTRYDNTCKVLDETAAAKKSGLSKEYSASVYIANYNRNSTITWACGDEKFSHQLSTLLYGETANGVLRLSCNFSIDSGYNERIPVYIGQKYCGDLAFGAW